MQGCQACSGALQGPPASYLRDWRPQTEDAASTSEDLAGLARTNWLNEVLSATSPHLVLALHSLHIDVQVQLPHAANDGLPTLSVYTDLQSSSRCHLLMSVEQRADEASIFASLPKLATNHTVQHARCAGKLACSADAMPSKAPQQRS